MATQVLLIEDVEDLGRKGDIVKVKSGFARNFLFPRSRAVVADANAVRMQERLKQERLQKATEDKKDAEAIAAKLATLSLETEVKVDHDGHMYGSVSILDILELAKKQFGFELEKRWVQLKHPIKKLGVHTIELKLSESVPASFSLKIISNEAPKESPKEA